MDDFIRNIRIEPGRLVFDDFDLGVEIGRQQLCSQPPAEAGEQPVVDVLQLDRPFIRCKDKLLAG